MINAAIPLQVRGPRKTNAMAEMMQALQIKNAQQDMKLRGEAAERQKAYRSAMAESGGDLNALRDVAIEFGDTDAVMKYDKHGADVLKSQREAESHALEVGLKKTKLAARLLGTARDPQSYAMARSRIAEFSPEAAQGMPEMYDPQYVQQELQAGLSVAERLSADLAERRFRETRRHNRATENRPSHSITINNTKPMSLADLQKLRLPDGSVPPIGMTAAEAREAGATLTTTDEAKAGAKALNGISIIDEIESLALGKGGESRKSGIFVGRKPGVLNSLKAQGQGMVQQVSQDDPRYAEYDSLVNGALAPLVKSLGDSGAITDSDASRVGRLIPQVGDTEEVARRKLKSIRRILAPAIKRAGMKASGPGEQAQEIINFEDLK